MLVAVANCLGDLRAVIRLACHRPGGAPIAIAILVALLDRTNGNAAVTDHDTWLMMTMMAIAVVVAVIVAIVGSVVIGALTGDINVVSEGGQSNGNPVATTGRSRP